MKKRTGFIILAAVMCGALLLSGCSSGTPEVTEENTVPVTTAEEQTTEAAETAPVNKTKLIATENMTDYVKFNGRTFLDSETGAIRFDWSASGFEVNFTGTGLKATLVSSLNSAENRYAYLYVYIDGADSPSALVSLTKTEGVYTLASGLEYGEHTLKVVKRTCTSYSSAGVKALQVLGENASFGEKPADKQYLIEIIGDSITCGDGVLTNTGTGTYCSDLQDVTKAYSWLLAEELDADIRLIARCGMGVVWNSSGKDRDDGGVPAIDAYQYTDAFRSTTKTLYDFSSCRKPDVIIVNLGGNDCKGLYVDSVLVPANLTRFQSEYAALLKFVREKNPDVPIICTFGQMRSSKYELGIQSVIDGLKAEGIGDISYIRLPSNDSSKYGTGLGGHPSYLKQADDAKLYFIPAVKTLLGLS